MFCPSHGSLGLGPRLSTCSYLIFNVVGVQHSAPRPVILNMPSPLICVCTFKASFCFWFCSFVFWCVLFKYCFSVHFSSEWFAACGPWVAHGQWARLHVGGNLLFAKCVDHHLELEHSAFRPVFFKYDSDWCVYSLFNDFCTYLLLSARSSIKSIHMTSVTFSTTFHIH